MKHTKEEILNALKVIQDECKGTECPECPFYLPDLSRCGLVGIDVVAPVGWVLNISEPETWRAFKS